MGVRRILVAMTIATALLPASDAPAYDDCDGQIGGFTVATAAGPVPVPHIADGMIIPIVDPAVGPFYLDIRYVMGRQTSGSSTSVNVVVIWLYQETNGSEGLQRGGSPLLPPVLPSTPIHDPCIEASVPDRAIF